MCDAYEVTAVIGEGLAGLKEALFLRQYTPNVTLISLGKKIKWSEEDLKKINQAAINIISNDILEIELSQKSAQVKFFDNLTVKFDSLYSALGCIKNNKVPIDVNAKLKKNL